MYLPSRHLPDLRGLFATYDGVDRPHPSAAETGLAARDPGFAGAPAGVLEFLLVEPVGAARFDHRGGLDLVPVAGDVVDEERVCRVAAGLVLVGVDAGGDVLTRGAVRLAAVDQRGHGAVVGHRSARSAAPR